MPKAPARSSGMARNARVCGLILASLLVPPALHADGHVAEFDFGGGYERGSSLWGVRVTGAVPFELRKRDDPFGFKRYAVVLDYGKHWEDNGSKERWTLMAGLRGLLRTRRADEYMKVMPYVQFLAGHLNEADGPDSTSTFVLAPGYGVDFLPWRKGLKEGDRWGFRLQLDFVLPMDQDIRWYPRVNATVVLRLEGPEKKAKQSR